MWKKMLGGILAILVLTGIGQAQFSTRDVEEKIYCPCGCGAILANCHCETAVKERAEISRELMAGKTPDEIIDKYVRLYGSSILVNQELESIKSASKSKSVSMLPLYIVGIAITGIVAYNLGKGSGRGKRRKKDENSWELK